MKHRSVRQSLPLRTFALLAALLFCALAVAAEPGRSDWRLVSDKNGIKVYQRHSDDSPLKTFRGVTRFPVSSLHAVSAVLNDTANIPRWMHFVDRAVELRRQDYRHREMVFYTDVPWPFTDREAVQRIEVGFDAQWRNSLQVLTSNAPELLPPNKDYIRFPRLTARLEIVGDPQTQMVDVTYEVVGDLGGYIPPWLVNIALKDAPYFTLDKLREAVLRTEYQSWRDPVLPFAW